LLSDLCSEREIVFSLHFSFLLATTSRVAHRVAFNVNTSGV